MTELKHNHRHHMNFELMPSHLKTATPDNFSLLFNRPISPEFTPG